MIIAGLAIDSSYLGFFEVPISSYYWHNRRTRNPPSLSEWLQGCKESQISNWKIYTIKDNIMVDFMMNYEDLPNELIRLRNKLNLIESIELPSEKPKGNVRKDRRPWQEVIDKISMERIRQVCEKEIEAFYSDCNR